MLLWIFSRREKIRRRSREEGDYIILSKNSVIEILERKEANSLNVVELCTVLKKITTAKEYLRKLLSRKMREKKT